VVDLPAFARRLFDDAAVFPPGLAPLEHAVPAHLRHLQMPYKELVGPLVIPVARLGEIGPLLLDESSIDVAVTSAQGPDALVATLALSRDPRIRVRAAEVALPGRLDPPPFFQGLERARQLAPDLLISVEVPRDARRHAVIAGCVSGRYSAKFRTGGTQSDLYPDEAELASSIIAAVDAGIPFKATAGLHRAVRNTDPDTGFEQHGFLNLLLATDAALTGGDVSEALRQRDANAIAAHVTALQPNRVQAVRSAFHSFGTCSIEEPLAELTHLGLVPDELTTTTRSSA
jgi:hypothetical protein